MAQSACPPADENPPTSDFQLALSGKWIEKLLRTLLAGGQASGVATIGDLKIQVSGTSFCVAGLQAGQSVALSGFFGMPDSTIRDPIPSGYWGETAVLRLSMPAHIFNLRVGDYFQLCNLEVRLTLDLAITALECPPVPSSGEENGVPAYQVVGLSYPPQQSTMDWVAITAVEWLNGPMIPYGTALEFTVPQTGISVELGKILSAAPSLPVQLSLAGLLNSLYGGNWVIGNEVVDQEAACLNVLRYFFAVGFANLFGGLGTKIAAALASAGVMLEGADRILPVWMPMPLAEMGNPQNETGIPAACLSHYENAKTLLCEEFLSLGYFVPPAEFPLFGPRPSERAERKRNSAPGLFAGLKGMLPHWASILLVPSHAKVEVVGTSGSPGDHGMIRARYWTTNTWMWYLLRKFCVWPPRCCGTYSTRTEARPP